MMEEVTSLRQQLNILNTKPSTFGLHKFMLRLVERIEELEMELDRVKQKVYDCKPGVIEAVTR